MSIPVSQRSIDLQKDFQAAKEAWQKALQKAKEYVAFQGDYPEDFHPSEKVISYRHWDFGGVYILYSRGKMLHIGVSKKIRSRIYNHLYRYDGDTFCWSKVRAIRIDNPHTRLTVERYLQDVFDMPDRRRKNGKRQE